MTIDLTKVTSVRSASNGPIDRLKVASAPPPPLRSFVGEDEQEVPVEPLADLGRLLVADRGEEVVVEGGGRLRALREQRVIVGQIPVHPAAGELIEVGVAFSAVKLTRPSCMKAGESSALSRKVICCGLLKS